MITQLINNNGNAVKNQFINTSKLTTSFQSYNSIIASVNNKTNVITLDPVYWSYSSTTLKHLKTFLNISDSKAQILKDIKNGVYKLKNLN
jgi:hydroxyethylthiazole kinase-like sugar kinase family protein